MSVLISVLCALENSNYKNLDGFDVWDKNRNAYNFTGRNPVITHAPCSQWSVLKGLSKPDLDEKNLAFFCLEKVKANGGIFEHPANSSFFREAGIRPTISVDQFWFGFPARKPTWLYFSDCEPLPVPLRFDARETTVSKLWSNQRSITTVNFALWLKACIDFRLGVIKRIRINHKNS